LPYANVTDDEVANDSTRREWENFYVIVGSSAGALIGLQFVIITLIAADSNSGGDGSGQAAFLGPDRIFATSAPVSS
jgi:hypothetical protein